MSIPQGVPRTFSEATLACVQILRSNPSIVARQSWSAEAEQLVCGAYRKVTGLMLSRFELLLKAKDTYPEAAAHLLLEWSTARNFGQPLQHLLGYQTFFESEYLVGPQVLIPRPETECLVASVIRSWDGLGSVPAQGIEIGLGSGVISIELLRHWRGLRMIASEVSSPAIALAVRNAERILGDGVDGAQRLRILSLDEPIQVMEPFSQLKAKADFLVTNPPYLVRGLEEVEAEVATYEPHLALFAPADDPLYFYRQIAAQAGSYLKLGGFIFAELPHERALPILNLFESAGWCAEVQLDLTQRERVLIARRA